MKNTPYLTLLSLLIFSGSAVAIQPTVKEVKDSRSTGEFFNGLTIELNLLGDDVNDLEAIRVRLDRAVDDSGRNLLKSENSSNDFKELSQYGQRQNNLTLDLLNPARKATTVQEISGTIEGYAPSKDPNAVIRLPKFQALSGKPLEHAGLKASGVAFVYFSAAELKKKREEELKKMNGFEQGLNQAFGSMFGGDENSLNFEVNDPNKRLVKYRVLDAAGAEISTSSRSWSGTSHTLSFNEPVPMDATLEIQLLTDKSIVKTPLKLGSVPLP